MTYPAPKGDQYQFRGVEFHELGEGVDHQSQRSKQSDPKPNENDSELLLRRVSSHRLLRSLPISIPIQALTLYLSRLSNIFHEFPYYRNARHQNESRSRIRLEIEQIPHCENR